MRRLEVVLAAACAVAALLAATPGFAQAPTLEIRVVPRIGLFNALQYKAAAADPAPRGLLDSDTAWKPLSKTEYAALVKERNPAESKLFLFGDWDMLTTDEGQRGYRSRRVQVTLSAGGSATDCLLRFRSPAGAPVLLPRPGLPPSDGYASPDCRFDRLPAIPSNQRLDVTLDLKLGGQPLRLTSDVPEDFLIVSLGDSYAAGQGNPDAHCVSGGLFWWAKPCAERAIWMDERCHRSAFAATIQAGLQMLRTESGLPAGHRGAVTIASLACSGATLANGILGRYEGQLDLIAFRAANADRGLAAADAKLDKADKLPDQIGALQGFLAQQEPASAKRSIDVLTVTIGGNDVGFAAALMDMILRRQKGQSLAQVETKLRQNLDDLRADLPRLQRRFAEMRSELGYEILQTMYTEYPDPTRVSADPDVFCADVPVDGFLGTLAAAVGYSLSAEETAVAYRVVVRGLNRIVADLSPEFAWRPVDGIMDNPELVGKGWCAEAPGGAYAAKPRWFRKADESYRIQGNVYGAMHPSWEMHDAIATRMLGLIAAGLQPRLRAELRNTALEKDAALVIRPPLFFDARDGTSSGSARLFCYGAAAETCNRTGEFALGGDAPAGFVRVLHDTSARWFRNPVRALMVDDQPPVLQACRIIKAGGTGKDCGSDAWLADGDEFYAHFEDRGRAGLAKVFWSTSARDTGTVPSARPQSVDGPLRLGMEIPPGRHLMYLAAVDRVGNQTAAGDKALAIPIRVDRIAPAFTTIAIHGHDFAGAPQPFMVPARIGDGVRMVVTGDDPISGIRSMSVTVAPGTVEESKYDAPNSEAATKCPALGALEMQKTWARPFNVAIARTTGGSADAVDARITALDCAENPAAASMVLIKLPASSPKAQDPAWWKANGASLDRFSPRVLALAGVSALPPYDAANARWPLAAAWLNLAAGMLDPIASAPLRIRFPACTYAEGASTVFSLMKTAQACVDDPAAMTAQDRERLLNALASVLPAVYAKQTSE